MLLQIAGFLIYNWIIIHCIVWSEVKVLVDQSCPTLCDPTDCSLPGSSVHGTLQIRILVAVPLSRESSQPRIQTRSSTLQTASLLSATREARAYMYMHKYICIYMSMCVYTYIHIYMPHFLYSFTSWYTLRLFPYLDFENNAAISMEI